MALDLGGRGVGVARYVRDPHTLRAAEVAIAVVDEWHRRGVGVKLLSRLAQRAHEEGVRCFTGVIADDNVAVVALVRAAGARIAVTGIDAGTVRFTVQVASLLADLITPTTWCRRRASRDVSAGWAAESAVAPRHNRRLLADPADRDVAGQPDELGVRPGQRRRREGRRARREAGPARRARGGPTPARAACRRSWPSSTSSRAGRRRAPALPAARSYSPRSPLSSGQPRPCVIPAVVRAAQQPRPAVVLLAVAVEGRAVPEPCRRRCGRRASRRRP